MSPPPTIVGTLADGTIGLRIEGLVAAIGDYVWIEQSIGEDFSSLIDRAIVAASAHTQDVTFAVPLVGGTFVRALQWSGGVLSAPSRVREVHGAVQPFPEPRPPLYLDASAEGMTIAGALPGCPVVLEIGGVEMARATADGDGVARVAMPYSLLAVAPGVRIQARVEVRWSAGPLALGTRVVNRDLSDPKWTLPVVDLGPFAGQTTIVVSSLVPGARLVVSVVPAGLPILPVWLAEVVAFSSRERVVLPRPLVEGDTLVFQQQYSGLTRYGEAPPEATAQVVVLANTLAPPVTVVGPVLVGDTSLMVRGMVEGATIQVVDSVSLAVMLDRPAGTSDIVDLASPITGDIQVSQLLSGALTTTFVKAEIVSVAPLPAMPIPFLVPPVHTDGRAALVMSVEPGARVAIRRVSDEALLGEAWLRTGDTAALVPLVPPTQVGDLLYPTAIRGEKGAQGASVVATEPLAVAPHIDGPIAWGARSVLVVGVTPGATVRIQSFGMYGFRSLGQVDAAEPIVRVPIDAAPFGLVWARTEIQGQVRRSGLVVSVPPPGAAGPYSTKEQFYAAGEAGAMPGQLYYPTNATNGYPLFTVVDEFGVPVHTGTLVVIQHGTPPVVPSAGTYLGYEYLAAHLASWGIFVFSIDAGDYGGDSSGNYVLDAVGAWKASPAPQVDGFPVPFGWFNRVGLVGHSDGGAAVHNAALTDAAAVVPLGIGAVIGFGAYGASVDVPPPLPWPGAPAFLNIVGSMDTMAKGGGVFLLHEALVRPATLLWVHRAYHNPWNTIWADLDDSSPTSSTAKPVGSLTDGDHKMIAKAMVTAFLVGHLWNWKTYLGFVDGRVWPGGLANYKIVADYRSATGPETRDGYLVGGPIVIDNFGDANAQLFPGLVGNAPGLVGNAPPGVGDVSTNSLGLRFMLTGPALTGGTVEGGGPPVDIVSGGQAIAIAWSTTEDLSLNQTITDETGGPDLSAVTLKSYVSLRLARRLEAEHAELDPYVEPPGPPVDWLIRLSDGTNDAYVRLGALGPVPYPDIRDASTEAAPPLGEIAGEDPPQAEVRATWRIQMSAFVAANSLLNLQALTELSLSHPSPEAAAGCWIDDMEVVS